ncbi:MAG: helix-turn-helix transcriptional regulator [Clostridia bacterium]|nr:helix-turn-helix transcriptional regulator [Clostridia bacterium]
MKFCEQLKLLRKTLNISQEKLAQKISVAYATINRLENDKTHPTYDTLQKLRDLCLDNGIVWENLNER